MKFQKVFLFIAHFLHHYPLDVAVENAWQFFHQFENIYYATLKKVADKGLTGALDKPLKVAIIGAGPAGLTIAAELVAFNKRNRGKNGFEITLLEKTNRVGGRVKTVGMS